MNIIEPHFKIGNIIKIIKEWSSVWGGVSELVGHCAVITEMQYMPHDQWHYKTDISSWYIPEDCIAKFTNI